MAKRMLNREEISLTQRNIDRHKRDVKIINYKIAQQKHKLLNWESAIKPKLIEDISKKKEEYIAKANLGEIEGVVKDTPYYNYIVEQCKLILENWELEEFELNKQIKHNKDSIDQTIKEYSAMILQLEEIITISEEQIKNGVDIKEPEENKNGK